MGTRSGRLILVATLLLSLQQSASLPRVRGGEGNESVSGALPAGTLRQRYQIAADVLSSSVAESLRRPIVTPLRSIGRTCERIAGRAGVIGYRLAPKLADQAAQRRHTRREDDSVCLTSGSVTLLPSSEACVSELLSRLDTATVQIDVMMYAWEDDATGREIACSLQHAALRGVQVRVIVDRLSLLLHNPEAASEPIFLNKLAAAPGAEVVQTAGAMCRFDHRKLVVVDGCCAWCGGMIFTHAARTQWDNLACLCEGPVVREFRNIFQQRRWSEAGGCACDRIPARNDCGSFSGGEPDCPTTQPRCSQIPPVQSPSRAVENQYSTELGPDPQGTTSPTQLQADSNVPGRTPIRIVRTDVGDRSLRQSVYHAVDTARRCVLLENCYFTDDLLTEKLIAARRRGVDVRVILTICGNIEIVNRYVVLTANRLHRGGVRVWLAPRMTHVKAMSVDHCWSYIGSGNFDDLSLRNNRELGIIVSGAAFAGEMQSAVFTPHLSQASELLRPLPMRPSTLLAKMLGAWL